MRTAAALAALPLALLLAGCSSSTSSPSSPSSASGRSGPVDGPCDVLARHAQKGLPAADRLEVARTVTQKAKGGPLQEQAAPLARTATGSDSAYRTAADTLAQACFDAGWKAP